MAVKDEVAHILFHIDIEAASSDASQSPGVVERAQKVRDLLTPFLVDNQTFNRKNFVRQLVRSIVDADLKAFLAQLDPNDGGQDFHSNLTEWVGGRG